MSEVEIAKTRLLNWIDEVNAGTYEVPAKSPGFVDALIAAVEREALERAFGIGDVYVEPVFMGAVPGWEKGGAYYDGYVKGATDYREGIRALIESKEG